MNLKKKWAVVACSVLVAGGLLSGAAYAATKADTTPKVEEHLKKAVQSGKLTQSQADVLMQLAAMRKAAMEKLKSDGKALIDQAVKDGKLTQEQADRLKQHSGHMGQKGQWHQADGKDHPFHAELSKLTPEQLKAKLDEAVKSGKLTQERADQLLQKFSKAKAKQN